MNIMIYESPAVWFGGITSSQRHLRLCNNGEKARPIHANSCPNSYIPGKKISFVFACVAGGRMRACMFE